MNQQKEFCFEGNAFHAHAYAEPERTEKQVTRSGFFCVLALAIRDIPQGPGYREVPSITGNNYYNQTKKARQKPAHAYNGFSSSISVPKQYSF